MESNSTLRYLAFKAKKLNIYVGRISMTCTNQQVKILMKEIKKRSQIVAAAKAGMSAKTARKYLKSQKLPTDKKSEPRLYRTRKDPFAMHWDEIESMLKLAPELQANTLLAYLMSKYIGQYREGQLRSLQRRIQDWRAFNGKDKKIIFPQDIKPGRQSQSDWTNMNALKITLSGEPFPHLLFHFMLPYSCWETIMICHSESFDTLTIGFEQAVWELGGVLAEHRTDNLSAATKREGSSRQFTERWQSFLDYYGVKPSRNNPGESHENGSVEKSHHLFINALEQHLLLRGSRDFIDQASYGAFLIKIKDARNVSRKDLLAEEIPFFKELPNKKWHAPTILPVRVSPSSVVHILNIPYSVPSRLISFVLKAHVYPEVIELYYGKKCIQKMPRRFTGDGIDYRHIIDDLIRKPGAFLNYQYKESLFPRAIFRQLFDCLIQAHPAHGHKIYLKILQLAKMHGEQEVTVALEILLEEQIELSIEQIKQLLNAIPLTCPKVNILQPKLSDYDQLHNFKEKIA